MDIEKELLRYKLKGYVLESTKSYSGVDGATTWFASTPPNSGDYLKGGLFDKTYSECLDKSDSIKSSIRKMKKYGY
jgi:hypothetical protein